jgi:hypothetical protein
MDTAELYFVKKGGAIQHCHPRSSHRKLPGDCRLKPAEERDALGRQRFLGPGLSRQAEHMAVLLVA